MNDVIGNPHTDDNLVGTAANDKMQGLSGNDVIFGGKGNDLIIGGAGSDVMTGGLGADTFQWSAGHITNGATDYITDFDIRQNDALSFLSSGGGQNVEIVGGNQGLPQRHHCERRRPAEQRRHRHGYHLHDQELRDGRHPGNRSARCLVR
ncbi:hypothetical protein [Bosea sp. UC22_33]|uniref:hypothetical protein n=1 Tax=Bosea sp. UC22_33 TaxID=3350165 RepID=UPI00366BE67A